MSESETSSTDSSGSKLKRLKKKSKTRDDEQGLLKHLLIHMKALICGIPPPHVKPTNKLQELIKNAFPVQQPLSEEPGVTPLAPISDPHYFTGAHRQFQLPLPTEINIILFDSETRDEIVPPTWLRDNDFLAFLIQWQQRAQDLQYYPQYPNGYVNVAHCPQSS